MGYLYLFLLVREERGGRMGWKGKRTGEGRVEEKGRTGNG